MIYIIMLLMALSGVAEEAPVPSGEVITDQECPFGRDNCEATEEPPPPSELPGPRPAG